VPAAPNTCAVCGKPLASDAAAASPLYPFCSQRCKQVDLLRWWDGRYAVVDPLTPEKLFEHLGDPPDEHAGERW
jgi:uncharacterized protein